MGSTYAESSTQHIQVIPKERMPQDTVADLLAVAVTYHQSGQLEEAEHLYETILEVDAHEPHANHNLGVIALNAARFDQAIQYLKTALIADPVQRQYWVSYIDALIKAGCSDEAHNVLMQGLPLGLRGEDVDLLANRLR